MQFNAPEYLFFFYYRFLCFLVFASGQLEAPECFSACGKLCFYGWWDWRFLFLIIFISGVNYYTGIQIGKRDPDAENGIRKRWLFFSILINLSILAVFKYFNFFSSSFTELFSIFGFNPDKPTLNIILPIGISFYTFQALSYVIDVYRIKTEPARDLISFFCLFKLFPAHSGRTYRTSRRSGSIL